MNLLTKQSYRYRKQSYRSWRESGGGIKKAIGMDTSTLLDIKEVIHEDSPFSTGHSTQYSVTTYMGQRMPNKG